jgi:hypothetical protein
MQALALVLLLAGHSRSEGRTRLQLDDTGRLDIQITVVALDLPELCDVDLATRDEGLRRERLRKLDACVAKDLPRLVRVRAAASATQMPCPLMVEGVDVKDGAIVMSAVASCPAFPEQIIVDWGLFAAQPLDHVSVATIEQPHAEPRLVMLSKRSSKLIIDVKRPLWPKVVGAVGVLAAAVLGTGTLLRWSARRRQRC